MESEIKNIQKWVAENNAIERMKEYFDDALKTCTEDSEPGEVPDRKDIRLYTKYVSLKIGNWPECDYNHIVVVLTMWQDKTSIGEYVVLYNFDGSVHDDILSFY